MNLQNFTQLIQQLQVHPTPEVEEIYFQFRKNYPVDYATFQLTLIRQNDELSQFCAILLRRDVEKNGQQSSLYQLTNPHEEILTILPLILTNPHLIEIIIFHIQFTLQKNYPFPEFPSFFASLLNENPVVGSHFLAKILQIPTSLIAKLQINFLEISAGFIMNENPKIAVYGLQGVANAQFLDENIPNEVIFGAIQRFFEEVKTQNLSAIDQLMKELFRIFECNNAVLELTYEQVFQCVFTAFQTGNRDIQLRMVKFGSRMLQLTQNPKFNSILTQFLQLIIIPSIGAYEDYQLLEWLEIGNLEFQSDDLIGISQKTLENCAFKQPNVVNELLTAFFNLPKSTFREQISVLMALNYSAEGFVDVISRENLQFYVGKVLEIANSAMHPRVLYSVANVFGQLCNDFQAEIKPFQKEIMACLVRFSEHEILHVRSHFIASILNLIIEMDTAVLLEYQEQLKKLILSNWGANDYYTKSNTLSILCSLIEVLSEEQLSELLNLIIPQIFEIFGQIFTEISVNSLLNKSQLDLVQRIIECLGFAVSYFPNQFLGQQGKIMEAFQTVFEYAKNNELIDLFQQVSKSIIKSSRKIEFDNIIQANIKIFTEIILKTGIQFKKDVCNEGELYIDSNLIDMQLVIMELISELINQDPSKFVSYYQQLVEIAQEIHSSNQLLNVDRIGFITDLLLVSQEISENEFSELQGQLVERISSDIDETQTDCKHYDLIMLDYVSKHVEKVCQNLKPENLHSMMEIIQYYLSTTLEKLNQELNICTSETSPQVIKELQTAYFSIFDNISYAAENIIQTHQQTHQFFYELAAKNIKLDPSSAKTQPLISFAFQILAELSRVSSLNLQTEYQFLQNNIQLFANKNLQFGLKFINFQIEKYPTQFTKQQIIELLTINEGNDKVVEQLACIYLSFEIDENSLNLCKFIFADRFIGQLAVQRLLKCKNQQTILTVQELMGRFDFEQSFIDFMQASLK